MVDIPEWLNYGGFGALLVVLAVVGRFVQVSLTNATCREREITDKTMARADKAEGAWRAMVESNIEVNARLATIMDEMCKEMVSDHKSNDEAHQSILMQLARMDNRRVDN